MVKHSSVVNEVDLAQIAQLVEQRTENPRVAGSIPALGIFYCVYWNMHSDNMIAIKYLRDISSVGRALDF